VEKGLRAFLVSWMVLVFIIIVLPWVLAGVFKCSLVVFDYYSKVFVYVLGGAN
jgi:hypothetical protein